MNDFREVDRQCFVALNQGYERFFGRPVVKYFIHNDCNYVDSFYANNDEDAIKEFRDRIAKGELERDYKIIK